MKTEDKYVRIIKTLRKNSPALKEKEKLVNEIIGRVNIPDEKNNIQEKLGNYIFRWFGIYWLRGAMAIVAVLLIAFFIIQQLTIAERLNSLETQLVKTVNTMNQAEPDLGTMHKILLKIVLSEQDSITVSRSDLEKLMNSYLELEKHNEENNLDVRIKHGWYKGINKKTKERSLENEL